MSDEWRTPSARATAVARALARERPAKNWRRLLATWLGCPEPPGQWEISLDPCGQRDQHVRAAFVLVKDLRPRVVLTGGSVLVRACGLEFLARLAEERLAVATFANVPFSSAAEWCRRLAALAGPTIMLGPAAPGSVYWRDAVWSRSAEVGFLGREAFVDHVGQEQPGARSEHALVAWRCEEPSLAAPEAVWVRSTLALPRRPAPGRGGADTDRARGRQGVLRQRLAGGEVLTAASLAEEYGISEAAAARALQRARVRR